jgi:hypothetical protein
LKALKFFSIDKNFRPILYSVLAKRNSNPGNDALRGVPLTTMSLSNIKTNNKLILHSYYVTLTLYSVFLCSQLKRGWSSVSSAFTTRADIFEKRRLSKVKRKKTKLYPSIDRAKLVKNNHHQRHRQCEL